jgi:hypothetical protein
VDTSYHYTIPSGPLIPPTDTLYTYGGSFRFVYTCSEGAVNGYIVADSVYNTESLQPNLSNSDAVDQNYTVAAVDPPFKVASMNGTLNSLADSAKTYLKQTTVSQETMCLRDS